MKAAELLVKCLEEEGIEYIFGVPGEENADFMLALSKSRKISHWRLQYAAMLEQVDEGLGAIMSTLVKTGEDQNTFVIFTSDNGGGLGPNGPLREGKARLYEGGLRVPFVVAGPGVRRGAQCDVPINQWDLLPTLHDYSKSPHPLPKDLDGGSLRSVFEKGNKLSLIHI